MAITLAEVETAVTEITTGAQSFSTSDGTVWNGANLKNLLELRDNLRSETARTDGTRPTIRAVNFSGMGY